MSIKIKTYNLTNNEKFMVNTMHDFFFFIGIVSYNIIIHNDSMYFM